MISDLAIAALLALLAYTWVGYPLLVLWLARPKVALPACPAADLPMVAVLIAAYNEEVVIADRVANLLGLEYPPDRLRVLIGVDGATDRTAERARAAIPVRGAEGAVGLAQGVPRIEVVEFPQNRGKMSVLKDLVAATERPDGFLPSTDILVFSDANTAFLPDALRQLVRHFREPTVGGVCGRLVFTGGRGESAGAAHGVAELRPPGECDGEPSGCRSLEGRAPLARRSPEGTKAAASPSETDADGVSVAGVSPFRLPSSVFRSSEEGVYWDLETRLKQAESTIDSCLGANGAVYAIRRELFWRAVPSNTIIDDFVIGMKVREAGRRMVFDPSAVATEPLPALASEWRRRVRIGAGDYQALWLCRRCLLPRYGAFAWAFWSHKVFRWLTPHLALAAGALAAWRVATCGGRLDAGTRLSVLVLAGGCLTLLLAILGTVPGDARVMRVPRLVRHFVTMQAALMVGFFRFCRGGLEGRWERTGR